jgi:hypothetical protein
VEFDDETLDLFCFFEADSVTTDADSNPVEEVDVEVGNTFPFVIPETTAAGPVGTVSAAAKTGKAITCC